MHARKMHCKHNEAVRMQKKISATMKRFVCFSNVVYFFVHYLLPNLVLLTLFVEEPFGFVICYKSYL